MKKLKFVQQSLVNPRYPDVVIPTRSPGVEDFGEDGWIAYFGNIQCGMFESKEEAEMALLKIMFAKNFDEINT